VRWLGWLVAAGLYVVVLLPPLVLPSVGIHAHPRAYLREVHGLPSGRLVKDAVLNIALFLPLGWLLAGALRRSALSTMARIGIVAGVAAALSISVETLQYFMPSRYSSILDVVSNVAGAALGAVLLRSTRG
jgi:VanZ family protein